MSLHEEENLEKQPRRRRLDDGDRDRSGTATRQERPAATRSFERKKDPAQNLQREEGPARRQTQDLWCQVPWFVGTCYSDCWRLIHCLSVLASYGQKP